MQSSFDRCLVSLFHSVLTYVTIPLSGVSFTNKFNSPLNILLLHALKKGAMHPTLFCFWFSAAQISRLFFGVWPHSASPYLKKCNGILHEYL